MTSLAEVISAFDDELPIERASTPPSAWYLDQAIYRLEQEAVFSASWQPVARVEQLRQPGSYVSGCFAGEPWVVTRAADGVLRAFANVCRHKGREVVTGAGRADQLVCGYHAWRYDLDGRLRAAPQMAGVRGFDRDAMALPALGVDEWGPWVFIHGEPNAPSMKSRLALLDQELEAGGWSRLRLAQRKSWTIECNWKVYADNYLDGGYHIPHMHPTLDAQLDMDRYKTELHATYSIQTCPPSVHDDQRIDYPADQRIGERAVYAWLFPNFMLNRYGPCLDSNHIVPLGTDRCRVDYDFYFLETEGDEAQRFIADSIAQSDITQREDVAICESVQRGLRSANYDRGRYAPRVEVGEHHFHRLLKRRYLAGVAG